MTKEEIEKLKVEWFERGRIRGRQEVIGAIRDLLELDKAYVSWDSYLATPLR